MGDLGSQSDSPLYLAIFSDHVLEPIDTAVSRVEQEQREIEREREAFEAFDTRVEDISPVSVPVPSSSKPTVFADSPPDTSDALREAYEETVMAVPHFECVYGEAIGENLTAEFGPEFTHLFEQSTDVVLTSSHKQTLLEATRVCVEERQRFADALDHEHESLQTSRAALATILETVASTVIPAWYADEFDTQVAEVVETRQTDITTQPSLSRLDGHGLYEYLNDDSPWSYPVLTGAGRLLEIVTVTP